MTKTKTATVWLVYHRGPEWEPGEPVQLWALPKAGFDETKIQAFERWLSICLFDERRDGIDSSDCFMGEPTAAPERLAAHELDAHYRDNRVAAGHRVRREALYTLRDSRGTVTVRVSPVNEVSYAPPRKHDYHQAAVLAIAAEINETITPAQLETTEGE